MCKNGLTWRWEHSSGLLPNSCVIFGTELLDDNFLICKTNQKILSFGFELCAYLCIYMCVSVQFSRSVVSYSLQPHELQLTRPPCPSPAPGVHSNSCALSRWCHPAISSSVMPFSSCPQSLPASGSFPMIQLFTWGEQSTGVSALASFLPMKSQGWSPS